MKNIISKIAVFAIMLFCSQMAFGQSSQVICFDDSYQSNDVWISAPYFNADLYAEIDNPDTYAEAWVQWDGGYAAKWCPGNCGFENIGRQDAGDIVINIGCRTEGIGAYAEVEAWTEW